MSVPRVAIFGAAGQLGRALAGAFESRGHAVTALTRQEVDVTSQAGVTAAIASAAPGLVLNAAAYNLVDAAEADPEAAYGGNALAVLHLAVAAARAGAKLVHFSSDYVFDGLAGRPYRESDPPRPLGAYGVSKLAGESYALAYSAEALVIRVAAVFGPAGTQTPRGNFLETMLRLAAQGKALRIVADQITSPTYTLTLAERTADLCAAGATGLVHAGGGTPVSWHDFAAMIFRQAKLQPSLAPIVTSEYPTPARRPPYSALGNVRMAALGLAPFPALEDCVADYLKRTNRT